MSHLVIDGWAIALAALGYRKLLGLPLARGVGLGLLVTVVHVPVAALLLR